MRSEKPADLLKLARALAASAEGMTLDEMADFSRVGRRTIERRRDAIETVFGALDRIEEGRHVRFRRNGRGLGSFAVAPTSAELAELENAVRARTGARDNTRAEILSSLHQKIRASLRVAERLRLDTDIAAQLRAEAFAREVGPRPSADPKILKTLREALLAGMVVKFLYGEDSDAALRWRKVIPYGLLFAPRFYLVARVKSKPEPVLFRLDRIHDLELTGEPGAPPADFDLEQYASRSFGVFQEEAEDIVLRFDQSAAPDARAYLFHPTQTMIDEADGSLTVRFHAAGLSQIAQHLMTWGSTVTLLAPDRLKELMWEEVEALYEHYRKMHRRPRAAKVAAE
jgi:predicted DNA-binding transcriptional regulator YafY